MDTLPLMLGVSIGLGLFGVVGYIAGMRKGWFDDLKGSNYRAILDDEEEERYQKHIAQQKHHSSKS